MTPARWTAWYWPAALLLGLAVIMIPEIWSLATGQYQNTLSDWVWRVLQVRQHQPISQWSAAHLLAAGVWVVLFGWLTWHFFGRWWR